MTSAAERLSEVMDDLGQPDDVPDRAWAVTEPAEADWALRKLAKVFKEMQQVQDLAESQIDALVRWKDAELDRLRPQRENWTALLAVYHRKRLVDDEKLKTIRLPHGVLTARKAADGVEIEDEAALIAWAKEHSPSVVRTTVKESIDRKAIKDAVLKDGESIPGVTPVEGEVQFTAAVDVEEVES